MMLKPAPLLLPAVACCACLKQSSSDCLFMCNASFKIGQSKDRKMQLQACEMLFEWWMKWC